MLVFVLTFVVMLAFQPLLKKYMPQPAAPQQQQSQPAPAAPGHRAGRNRCAGGRDSCEHRDQAGGERDRDRH